MQSAHPKVLHQVCGRSMLAWVLEAALELDPERVILVVGHGRDEVQAAALAEFPDAPISCVVQEEQLGTGHAVECAAGELQGFDGAVVVLCGDMPLLRSESLAALLEARSAEGMAMLTSFTESPTGYGRIVRDEEGSLQKIVEERDASHEERLIPEINSGVYAFGCSELLAYLGRVESENSQGERYLTDVPGMYAAEGREVGLVELLGAEEHAVPRLTVQGKRASREGRNRKKVPRSQDPARDACRTCWRSPTSLRGRPAWPPSSSA